jgi:multimeric flavodoxin WrbA
MVKILGVCGSPRKAATEYALRQALDAASQVPGVEVELVTLRGKKINFCIHCDKCIREDADRCLVWEDYMSKLYDSFYEADGYIFASPVYDMGITGQLTTYFNRFRPIYTIVKKNPDHFSNRVGGAIAVGGTRNGGQECTINNILGFYQTNGIMAVSGGLGVYGGASVWSQDKKAQGAEEDTIGIKNVRTIGRKVAEAAVIVKAGAQVLKNTSA